MSPVPSQFHVGLVTGSLGEQIRPSIELSFEALHGYLRATRAAANLIVVVNNAIGYYDEEKGT